MFLGGHGFNILILLIPVILSLFHSNENSLVLKLLLFNHYKFLSDYLYSSNNLKDIKDHILDYIVSCKIFLQ